MQHYMIVSAKTVEDLTAVVNQHMAGSWRAEGGPFIIMRSMWVEPQDAKEKARIAQALVRK